MFGSKGKTPVTRIKREPEPESEAAGGVGDAFEDVGFLEDLNALLDKIQGTAENVTTCQVRVPRFRLHLGFRLRLHLARTSQAAVAQRGTDRRCRTRSRSCSTASCSCCSRSSRAAGRGRGTRSNGLQHRSKSEYLLSTSILWGGEVLSHVRVILPPPVSIALLVHIMRFAPARHAL